MVISRRVLLGAAVLAGVAFLASFAVGRAFRGERRPGLSPPPVVVSPPLRLAPLGAPARLPALRPATAHRQTSASG
jgi:hypothetical protein